MTQPANKGPLHGIIPKSHTEIFGKQIWLGRIRKFHYNQLLY